MEPTHDEQYHHKGGGVWYTLDLDYKRIANIFRKAGAGYIPLEMEGNEQAEMAMAKTLEMLRAAFA